MFNSLESSLLPGHSNLRSTLNSTESIGRALRPRKHSIGLVVILKAFPDRIPKHLSLQFHRGVMNQASGAGSVPDFYRGDWLLPRPYTLEPVSVMFFALVQMNFIRANDRSDDLRVTGG